MKVEEEYSQVYARALVFLLQIAHIHTSAK